MEYAVDFQFDFLSAAASGSAVFASSEGRIRHSSQCEIVHVHVLPGSTFCGSDGEGREEWHPWLGPLSPTTSMSGTRRECP